MKKIGILTVHRAVNFGAVLQMYGLYVTLKKMGADPFIVDYRAEIIENREDYIRNVIGKTEKNGLLRNIFAKADYIFALPFNYKKKKKFALFLHNRFKLTRMYTNKNIEDVNEEADIFIAGSDQIWNRKLIDDDIYYLSFAKDGKKYSYAASFGNNIGFEIKKEHNLRLLKSFSSISVRESIGKEEIENYVGKKIETNIDPSILLNYHEWSRMAKMPANISESDNYIVLYWASRRLKKFAVAMAQMNNWKIYDMNEGIIKGKIKNLRGLGPEEFLGLIKNAKFVCTTSFHGLVFSVLFHIPFKIDFSPTEEGANMRQKEMIKITEIEGCNINQNENIVSVNWSKSDANLEIEREKARAYLAECIGK